MVERQNLEENKNEFLNKNDFFLLPNKKKAGEILNKTFYTFYVYLNCINFILTYIPARRLDNNIPLNLSFYVNLFNKEKVECEKYVGYEKSQYFIELADIVLNEENLKKFIRESKI